VLGDGWVGFDQDHSDDQMYLRILNTYAEVSPSGEGAHALARGQKPGSRAKKGGLELYDHDRYFTVTGHHLAGYPTTVEERTAEIAEVYKAIFGGDQLAT
jgi:putative DNA primase/helicase